MGHQIANVRSRLFGGLFSFLALVTLAAAPARAEEDHPPQNSASTAAACEPNAMPGNLYDSPAAQQLRREQLRLLLQNPRHLEKLSSFSKWNPHLIEGVQFRKADLRRVIENLLGPASTVTKYSDYRVLYEAADRPIKIIENPRTRTFRIERRERRESIYLDEFGQRLPDQHIRNIFFQTVNQAGTVTGDLASDIGIYRGLTAETLRINGKVERTLRRVADYSRRWERRTLGEGILRFVGSDPAKLTLSSNSNVFKIKNLETGISLVDNPVGRYYKIIVEIGKAELSLDWNGLPALDDNSVNRARFYYGGGDDAQVAEGVLLAFPEGRAPEFNAAPRFNEETLAQVQRMFARRILSDRFPRHLRLRAMDALNWRMIRQEDRRHFFRILLDQSARQQWEYEGLLNVAYRSGDPKWGRVLDAWQETLRGDKRDWARLVLGYIDTTLKHLEKFAVEQGLPARPPIREEVKAVALTNATETASNIRVVIQRLTEEARLTDLPPVTIQRFRDMVEKTVPGFAYVSEKGREAGYEALARFAANRVEPFAINYLQRFDAYMQRALMRHYPNAIVSNALDPWDLEWAAGKLAKIPDNDSGQGEGWLHILLHDKDWPILPGTLRPWLGPKGDGLSEGLRQELYEFFVGVWSARLQEGRDLDEPEATQLQSDALALARRQVRLGEEPRVDERIVSALAQHQDPERAKEFAEKVERAATGPEDMLMFQNLIN